MGIHFTLFFFCYQIKTGTVALEFYDVSALYESRVESLGTVEVRESSAHLNSQFCFLINY